MICGTDCHADYPILSHFSPNGHSYWQTNIAPQRRTLPILTNMGHRFSNKVYAFLRIALIRDRMYVVQENGGMCCVMRCVVYMV
jgi:hypothetical protein